MRPKKAQPSKSAKSVASASAAHQSVNPTLPPAATGKPDDLYWIAIGASAGGLEALRELISRIPAHPSHQLTYIIAQHLSPTHQSMLVQLLARETKLAVAELTDFTSPQPDVIYITPPNKDVFVQNGVLRLSQPISELSPKPSIDHFFASLAEYAGDRVVGIVLSGTGSDGSHGVRAIRAAGGLTVAQDPASAKYDTMPRRAIETNCVDLVLEPKLMIAEVLNIIQVPGELTAQKDSHSQRSGIQELLHLLKLRCGVDFTNYKTGTLFRRINRRMVAQSAAHLPAYLECIERNPKELDALFRDVMITVTTFFRDPDSFEALKSSLRSMVERKTPEDPIRVWVPGCATGEEAYSVAILLAEACGGAEKIDQKFKVQIFATDIDIEALARARKGVYPQAALANLGKQLREKYFRHREHAYEIIKPIRDMVVFSRHNVFDDPPFLRLDLISCRNLLIYFNTKLQHTVFNVFHYALRHEGILFLGKSESLGQSTDLFVQSDAKHKLFRRRIVAAPGYQRHGAGSGTVFKKSTPAISSNVGSKTSHDFPDALIQALSPDSLLIDENMEVLRVYGDVRAYTQLSPGGASTNLMSLARAEVRQELRALIYKILREDLSSTVLPKRLMTEGELHEVKILVRPLRLKNSNERLLLVSFEKVRPLKTIQTAGGPQGELNPLIAQMEQELAATKEHLQTVIEELETSNEELQSTNEEMQSSNEELQSSNEELETANEELQSTNEELLTVNEELQVKSAELVRANEDLNNIKDSIDYPLLVVDRSLMLKRFNTAAGKVFSLTDEHLNSSVLSLAAHIDIPNLRESALRVIEQGGPHSQQLDGESACYLLRIIPFRDSAGKIEGAVITFFDNTVERRAVQGLRRSEQRYQVGGPRFQLRHLGVEHAH